MQRYKFSLIPLFFALLTLVACGQSSKELQEQDAIRQQTLAYVRVYNQRDSAALAKFWAEDAVYVNPESSQRIEGRDRIISEFKEMFSEFGDLNLQMTIEAVELQGQNHAVQKGTARVTIPGRLPMDSNYTNSYIKKNGVWLIQRSIENDIVARTETPKPLKDLGWLIGRWVDEGQNGTLITRAKWEYNNHFIRSAFNLTYRGHEELAGEQIIGWDPSKNQVRSWIFDSDGGIGEGTWSHQGNRWFVDVKSTLPGGQKASSVHIYTLVDSETYKFQINGREIDGKILPNIEEISIVRKKSS